MVECLIDDTHFIRQGEVESRCWCLGNDTCGVVPCVLFRARADLSLFACPDGTRTAIGHLLRQVEPCPTCPLDEALPC